MPCKRPCLVKNRFYVHSVLFMHVFIHFFSEHIFVEYQYTQELLHHRDIANIDPHASHGNAVAGQTPAWRRSSEDPSQMMSPLKKTNRY